MKVSSSHSADELIADAVALRNPELAAFQQKFFKTYPGGYGEGDLFLGLTVPQTRELAKKYVSLAGAEITVLLRRAEHELRLTALHILEYRYAKVKTLEERQTIVTLYLENLDMVNNWDLVDTSCYKILGRWLYEQSDTEHPTILWKLAESGKLWKERIAIVATMWFIRQGLVGETYALARHFIAHPHDLMHKAVGWLVREAGKKDPDSLHAFLEEFAATMPRTMLRYAIERLSPEERQDYMQRAKKV